MAKRYTCCDRAKARKLKRCNNCKRWLVTHPSKGRANPNAGRNPLPPEAKTERKRERASAKSLPDYCGAKSRISLDRIRKLDASRYRLAVKHDGIYARIELDSDGRIARIATRTGQELDGELVKSLMGARIGPPDSVLVGELEAWSQRSERAVARRGYRRVYLFDALRIAGEDMTERMFSDRLAALYRSRAELEQADRDRPWEPRADRHKRAHCAETGRFSAKVPAGWRLAPIVPTYSLHELDRIWRLAERGKIEGLVVIDMRAPVGKRNSKRKLKPIETIDAILETSDWKAATMYAPELDTRFVVSWPSNMIMVAIGEYYEISHEGFTELGQPRFARIARHRPDLNP